MKLSLPLAVLFAIPAVCAAAPLRLAGGPSSEDSLRKFVSSDQRLKDRIADAALREQDFRLELRDPGLRDALSDSSSPDELKHQLEKLPGLRAEAAPSCATLSDCAAPELAANVAAPELIPETLRRLVRPWMLLQQARRSIALLTPVTGPGDAVLRMELKGTPAQPMLIDVTPRPLGGFKVWFEEPLVLADLYGRERDAALKSAGR